ncbi:hypothetical protein G6F56_009323 [Rhizopus delemar]|uniref:Uncharacterized protein n=1 Tax=Rhizopus stolonifer TaxID=4846 RepID=A0A367JJP9_RHIST|nr:hypothetical protein G6F56_009323 [Rhizopus delemar]RCH90172.1 hypothetical protein CU098_008605 [Rhizopus stolonifer]
MNPTREAINAYLLRFNRERLLVKLPDDATTAHLLLQGLTNTLKTRAIKVLATKADDSLGLPTEVSSFVDARFPSYTPTCITIDGMELVEAPIVKKKGKNAVPAWQEFSRDNDDGRSQSRYHSKVGSNLYNRASGNMISKPNHHNDNSSSKSNYQQGNFNNQQKL